MEMARTVTNVISYTEGQNLAGFLTSKEMADKSNATLWQWSKGYKFVSCQDTVDDFKLLCRIFDKAIWLHWLSVRTKCPIPYGFCSIFLAPGQFCGLYATNVS